eukprot:TRINITY_DN6796_c0_g2_i1.p1 TRINITY_DN6796_c0_g2~~TRINITY_DN6796_c0_g2_i1.p1  ORF type:complete len:177 (+),score=24.69 TRINITY_DN6796_c0_g2_i1:39-533(+)
MNRRQLLLIGLTPSATKLNKETKPRERKKITLSPVRRSKRIQMSEEKKPKTKATSLTKATKTTSSTKSETPSRKTNTKPLSPLQETSNIPFDTLQGDDRKEKRVTPRSKAKKNVYPEIPKPKFTGNMDSLSYIFDQSYTGPSQIYQTPNSSIIEEVITWESQIM